MKNYSHSIITKMFVFIIAVSCFTGAIKAFVDVVVINDGDFNNAVEENYFQSRSFVEESENLISDLTRLIGEYKSEEHILSGGSINE
ncbi:MAG TPA: hypothetical protein VEY51_01335, partial [Chondromyces sp.]|nr:hypothetical protein [Chondromyces sp.]